MKIRDLDFINKKDVTKLRRYAFMTVEDYIKKIKSLKDSGVRPNKLLQTIYDELVTRESKDTIDKECPTEVEGLDWYSFKVMMNRELSIYKDWFVSEGFDLNSSIEKFVKFLQYAENTNLKKNIPLNLNHYWLNRNDLFYRTAMINCLATGFEGLLQEINFKNKGIKIKVDGLCEILKDSFPHLMSLTTTHISRTKGFDKVFINLRNYRNKFCHGRFIDPTISENENILNDFTALFVQTVSKYAA